MYALSVLASTAAEPRDSHSDFRNWIEESAEQENLRIFQWGAFDLDRDGVPSESFAYLCSTSASEAFVVLSDGKKDAWIIRRPRSCEDDSVVPADTLSWRELDVPSYAVPSDDNVELYEVGVVDGAVEIVRARYATRSSSSFESRVVDWVERTVNVEWGDQFGDQGETESALIIVDGPNASGEVRPVSTVVIGQVEPSGGNADALDDASALSVSAAQAPGGLLRLVVEVKDDVRRPIRSASQLSVEESMDSFDHLELWWCKPGLACSKEPRTWQRLLVGWLPSGEPMARWAYPRDGPAAPPLGRSASTQTRHRLELSLPLSELVRDSRLGAESWRVPVSIVFFDVDSKRPGSVERTIATSQFVPGEPRSMAWLAKHPEYSSFPTQTEGARHLLEFEAVRKVEIGAGIQDRNR